MRKIFFIFIAKPIYDVNAGKLKKELALKQSTVVPTLKKNRPIPRSKFCHKLSNPLTIQRSNRQQPTSPDICNLFWKVVVNMFFFYRSQKGHLVAQLLNATPDNSCNQKIENEITNFPLHSVKNML